MKKLLAMLIVLWGVGAAGFWYWNDAQSRTIAFRTVAVKRGDLLTTINSTGTLSPRRSWTSAPRSPV